jgi:hypothetical protein
MTDNVVSLFPEEAAEIAVKLMRDGQPAFEVYYNVDAAVAASYRMVRDEGAIAIEVVSLDGEILLRGSALEKAIKVYGQKHGYSREDNALPPPEPIPEADRGAAAALAAFLGVPELEPDDWHGRDERTKVIWRKKAR